MAGDPTGGGFEVIPSNPFEVISFRAKIKTLPSATLQQSVAVALALWAGLSLEDPWRACRQLLGLFMQAAASLSSSNSLWGFFFFCHHWHRSSCRANSGWCFFTGSPQARGYKVAEISSGSSLGPSCRMQSFLVT